MIPRDFTESEGLNRMHCSKVAVCETEMAFLSPPAALWQQGACILQLCYTVAIVNGDV